MSTIASKGATARGAWILLGEALTTQRIASAGFDWICLDQQHGAVGPDALVGLMPVISRGSTQIAVRVIAPDPSAIGRALDVGADIVIVPMIESGEMARDIVAAAHYPPKGRRSWGPLTGLWGSPAPSALDARPRVWAMIETASAIDALDAIVSTEGLAGVFVGPYDLSLALGVSLEDLLQDRRGILAGIVARARTRGIDVGAYAGSPAVADRLARLGFEHLAITTDVGIVDSGVVAALGGGKETAGY